MEDGQIQGSAGGHESRLPPESGAFIEPRIKYAEATLSAKTHSIFARYPDPLREIVDRAARSPVELLARKTDIIGKRRDESVTHYVRLYVQYCGHLVHDDDDTRVISYRDVEAALDCAALIVALSAFPEEDTELGHWDYLNIYAKETCGSFQFLGSLENGYTVVGGRVRLERIHDRVLARIEREQPKHNPRTDQEARRRAVRRAESDYHRCRVLQEAHICVDHDEVAELWDGWRHVLRRYWVSVAETARDEALANVFRLWTRNRSSARLALCRLALLQATGLLPDVLPADIEQLHSIVVPAVQPATFDAAEQQEDKWKREYRRIKREEKWKGVSRRIKREEKWNRQYQRILQDEKRERDGTDRPERDKQIRGCGYQKEEGGGDGIKEERACSESTVPICDASLSPALPDRNDFSRDPLIPWLERNLQPVFNLDKRSVLRVLHPVLGKVCGGGGGISGRTGEAGAGPLGCWGRVSAGSITSVWLGAGSLGEADALESVPRGQVVVTRHGVFARSADGGTTVLYSHDVLTRPRGEAPPPKGKGTAMKFERVSQLAAEVSGLLGKTGLCDLRTGPFYVAEDVEIASAPATAETWAAWGESLPAVLRELSFGPVFDEEESYMYLQSAAAPVELVIRHDREPCMRGLRDWGGKFPKRVFIFRCSNRSTGEWHFYRGSLDEKREPMRGRLESVVRVSPDGAFSLHPDHSVVDPRMALAGQTPHARSDKPEETFFHARAYLSRVSGLVRPVGRRERKAEIGRPINGTEEGRAVDPGEATPPLRASYGPGETQMTVGGPLFGGNGGLRDWETAPRLGPGFEADILHYVESYGYRGFRMSCPSLGLFHFFRTCLKPAKIPEPLPEDAPEAIEGMMQGHAWEKNWAIEVYIDPLTSLEPVLKVSGTK